MHKSLAKVSVIGLWKECHGGVYNTLSARHAQACIMAGADVVAIDAKFFNKYSSESTLVDLNNIIKSMEEDRKSKNYSDAYEVLDSLKDKHEI